MQMTLKAEYQRSAVRGSSRAHLFALLMMAVGVGGWWFNWHLAETKGEFYIKACLLGPLGIFGGLLMLLRPEWAGPLRGNASRAHKAALFTVLGLMAVASGIDFYRLDRYVSSRAPRNHVIAWSPGMGTPSFSKPVSAAAAPEVPFLGRRYRLGSFNQKQNATWEFVAPGETVDDWKTLLTIIDRTDVYSLPDLDRLGEGILSTYKSHGARILSAHTTGQGSAAAANYLVAAFDEAAQQRFELSFVKMSMGPKNGVVVVYGVRVGDAQDYRARAREFLDANSSGIGHALEGLALPGLDALPRRVF